MLRVITDISPEFVALFHHRWSVPIIAALDNAMGGAKFVTLMRQLDVPRNSLKRTIEALIAQNLVKRNPGYGHPMRPELILTRSGCDCTQQCDALLHHARRVRAEDVVQYKWSMPVLLAIGRGAKRFSEIRTRLASMTPRALAIALHDLDEAGLIERFVIDAHPPGVQYIPAAISLRIIETLDALEESICR